jgi:hypothetical protein
MTELIAMKNAERLICIRVMRVSRLENMTGLASGFCVG